MQGLRDPCYAMPSPIIEVVQLQPKQKSLAKAKPVQSSELTEKQVFEVYGDRPFKVFSYEPSDNGHYHAVLAGDPHPQLGKEVELFAGHFEGFPPDLDVNHDTWLKADPTKQSSELPDDKKLFLPKGSSLIIDEVGDEIKNKSIQVRLQNEHGGMKEGWVFLGDGDGHCAINGCEIGNDPTKNDEQKPSPPPKDRGRAIKCPGISATLYTGLPVDPKSPNITWGEMTKGGTRIPATSRITAGMIKIAIEMQKIRGKFGDKPIRITSGYRPTDVNRRVGGAPRSRHTDPNGDAVDFYIVGLPVGEVFKALNPYWPGGLAVSYGMGFVHIDLRPARARWTYPR